ncbi:MAG: CocE/NonD family hydrolase [Deltaproteobacteria bacterium]|nr:CocE/NonD family hydrolase [Deltaproteobacteria bacterium]
MGSARSAITTAAALFLCLTTTACGSAAQPRGPASPAQPRPPLIQDELESPKQIAAAIRAHYTKYEYRIPMRDSQRLFTAVFVPKDRSHAYPIMLLRTPYSVGPYGVDRYPEAKAPRDLQRFAPSPQFIRKGYIFVHQDVRGKMMSEGTFVDMRPAAKGKTGVDESTDAYDTVDWLVKNVAPNNGRVGVWGISYPGFYAAQAAVDAHPAVKAVSPQAPVTEWFIGDDFHHNGALMLADAFDFYASFGKKRPKPTKKSKWGFDHDKADVYDFFLAMGPLATANQKYLNDEIPFWNDLMTHGTRDAYWEARDPRPRYRKVKPAVMTVGGWFDAEDLWGTLATYQAFEDQSPGADNVLVMGPWEHGGWARSDGDHHGDITFGTKTAHFYRERIELPFFERHLDGLRHHRPPEAWVYETGKNEWHAHAQWPPKQAKRTTVLLQAGGALATSGVKATASDPGFDEYRSDPHKPVPYFGKLTARIDKAYMTADQRFAARRPDVLVYATGELTEDVTVAGPIETTLWVSTTGTDADFVVKVIDVHPEDLPNPTPNPTGFTAGGYQQLIRGEVMRGKFRNSFARPEPFEPGKPTVVKITLPAICHTFRTGHRLMVQIQSSWFPLVDRNPQTFTNIYQAGPAAFRAATHRVYRTADKPSAIELQVLAGTLPKP